MVKKREKREERAVKGKGIQPLGEQEERAVKCMRKNIKEKRNSGDTRVGVEDIMVIREASGPFNEGADCEREKNINLSIGLDEQL